MADPERPAPTRATLLALQARIGLARQGRDLLEQKRTELMKALRALAREALDTTAALERVAAEARRALGRAEAVAGPETVRSAAWAATGDLRVRSGVETIMGVRLPALEAEDVGRDVAGRGYDLLGTSPWIDVVAERFEAEVELLVALAARERRLRALAVEVRRTTRRVNALEHALIPRLEARRERIAALLEEREREERFRLRRLKARRR